MTWFLKISRILQEEQFLIKYYVKKHLILLKIQSIMDINADLLQLFMNFLIKKVSGGGVKSYIMPNQRPPGLAKQLNKPVIRKFEKRKVCSSFKGNFWDADLVDM